ncbi:MAG: NlpC/P60 family protein [Monoglobales bacterium]
MKNLLFSDPNAVLGLSVKRCNVRRVHGETENLDFDGFDQNQESALLPFSLVKVMNKWDDYLFIKSHVATGWVPADAIAIISHKQAGELFFPEKFCVVTEPNLNLCGEEYYMSCKIPLDCGLLRIPYLDDNVLHFKSCPVKEGCHIGYLPFSRNNLLSQAIKFLDTPYDWGEKSCGLDCSSLIMHSFACFGIILPRSSGEQAKVTFPVSAYPAENAYLAKPADIIYMPGHVMLSLGDSFVLHASATAKKVTVGKL